MTKKDLQEIVYSKRRLADLKERLKELRDAAERITSDLSGMPHCSGDHDKMASYAASVDELERQILAETIRLEQMRLDLEGVIECLPAQQKTIIHLRYIKGLSWYKVSKEAHYSIQHCHKIEQAAVARLSK